MLWFRKPSKKKIECDEQFERCVICGELTHYTKDTPIEERECYEIGCGQLCYSCYRNTSGESPLTPSESEMRYLIAQCQKKDEK